MAALAVGFLATDRVVAVLRLAVRVSEAALVAFRADVFGAVPFVAAERPAVLLRELVPVAFEVVAVFRAVVLVAGRVVAVLRAAVFAAGRVDAVRVVAALPVPLLTVPRAVVLVFLAAGRVAAALRVVVPVEVMVPVEEVAAFRTVVFAAERVAAVFLTADFVAVALVAVVPVAVAFAAGRVEAVAFFVVVFFVVVFFAMAFLAVAFAAGWVTALLRAVFAAGRVAVRAAVVLVGEPAEVFFAAAVVAVPAVDPVAVPVAVPVVAVRRVVTFAAARVLAAPLAAGRFAAVFRVVAFAAGRVAAAFFAVAFFAVAFVAVAFVAVAFVAGRPVTAVFRAPIGSFVAVPAALTDLFAARGAGIFAAPDPAVGPEPDRPATVAVRPARLDADFAAAEAVLLAEATLLVAPGVWAGLAPVREATLLRARSEADLAATDAVLLAEATLRVAVVFGVLAGEVRLRVERAAVAVATGRATRSPAGCVAAVVVFEGTVPPG